MTQEIKAPAVGQLWRHRGNSNLFEVHAVKDNKVYGVLVNEHVSHRRQIPLEIWPTAQGVGNAELIREAE